MALALERNTYTGVFRRLIGRRHTSRVVTNDNITDPAGPDAEGVIRTGGVDSSLLSEPQELRIRIIGSRDPRTGEILPCHQKIHDTYREVKPLEGGQEVTIE